MKPGGLALLQAITIEDHRYERALREVDYIKRHVFPGAFIPSVSAMLEAKRRVTDLNLMQFEDFGLSYARTLEAWRKRFLAQRSEVRRLGFDDQFIRLWEFYLAYCEGGFRERSIGVGHFKFAKPAALTRRVFPDEGVINFVAYQAVWFAVVASAAHRRADARHGGGRAFRQPCSLRSRAAAPSMCASWPRRCFLGVVVDGTLGVLGWLRYASPAPALPPHGAPLWILCLWASFALTLTRSLAWFMRRPWLGALLGALGGPLAYASAARGFAAVEFVPPAARAVAGLALGWGAAMPVLAYVARRGAAGRAVACMEAQP